MTIHLGRVIAARENLTVINCQSCGYAHLDRFPSDAELDKFYQSDFWQKEKAGELANTIEQQDWLNAIYGDWLSLVGAYTRGRTLLDVGSGYGLFLELAHSEGWNTFGIEPNTEAADYSMGKGSLIFSRDEQVGNTRFDCVSAMWLIEHLPKPLDFLKWCRMHLEPGGVLLAAVPQEWTEDQAKANGYVAKKNWYIHHTHLNYFSQTSFANLLGRAGFHIVELLASYPMETFITDTFTNYIDFPYLGKSAHKVIEAQELDCDRERRIAEYRHRARFGHGRDLIVVAKYG